MPGIHWTYENYIDEQEPLSQGDILARTPALLEVLRGCHAYFVDPQYVGFMVVSQSCDLVERGGDIRTPYITLAVIRELDPLLPQLLQGVCSTPVDGVYDEDKLDRAVTKLSTLINQNEQTLGYFYLHPIEDTADNSITDVLATRSVAMLRVKISLRKVHYQTLRESRRLGLVQPYAAKLGWLVGNLYSRVATPDWEDKETDARASKEQAREILKVVSEPSNENWVSGRLLEAKLVKNSEAIQDFDRSSFRSNLSILEFESPSKVAGSAARDIATLLALEAVDLEVTTKFETDSELLELLLGLEFQPKLSEETKAIIREDKKVIQRLAGPIAILCNQLVDEVAWDAHSSPFEWCAAASSLLKQELEESHFSKARARIETKLSQKGDFTIPNLASIEIKEKVSKILRYHWLTIRNCKNIMKKLPDRLRNSSDFMDSTKPV